MESAFDLHDESVQARDIAVINMKSEESMVGPLGHQYEDEMKISS